MKTFNFLRATILLFSCFFCGCSLISSFNDDKQQESIEISSLSLTKSSLTVSVGDLSYIAVSVKPSDAQKNVKLNWVYDTTLISCDTSSAWGITIKGLKEGQTNLRCSYNGYDASCVVTVQGYSASYKETVEPYIYSNTTILQTAPGVTEKVYCSLYGGTAADIDGYTWTCDNSSVAAIEPTGQYCLITAKNTGYARIKVTHSKAAYPYYIGIYVFTDATSVSYITTNQNIFTMNLADDEQTISVSLINGKEDSSDNAFCWEIINEDENCPIKYETNGNKAVIRPVKSGSCTIRVTHPNSAYPLDILCRVISIIKNVYIEPSTPVLTLSGDKEESLSSSLINLDVGEYNIDAFKYTLDDYSVADIVGWVGNEVILKGKANGSCKLSVSHEKAAYSREVLVIVNNQLTDALDSSCYITTSQNYIRTKLGAEGSSINISLKGGVEGDESGFKWSIKSTPTDGTNNDVITMSTSNGTINYSRSAWTYAYGTAVIEPKYEGTAVITISHPKVVYPTEILVKVLNKDAVLTEPLYFTGESLVKLLNGTTVEYNVQLKGKNKSSNDDENISWVCNNPLINISANANVANITAPHIGSGNTVAYLTASHNKADSGKKVMILTADTVDELANIKALYSDKLYYNLEKGESAYCMTNSIGFATTKTLTDENGTTHNETLNYDFSMATWTVQDAQICTIEKSPSNPLNCKIIGQKAGTTTVSVSVTDSDNKIYTCDYAITVYPVGTIQTSPEVYFTTSQNVVNLEKAKDETTINVYAINLIASEYPNISWQCENSSIANVIGNGTSATITAVAEGETVINVTHKDSQNILKIYVRVGSAYVIKNTEPITYISSNDVITMLKDDSAQRLDAVLTNYTAVDKTGFKFTIDKESIATITSQSTNGIAYIKPVSSGQAEITISHPKSSTTKKVLVVVGNSKEELSGYTYLTTSSNVIAIGEGNTRNVTVSVKNSPSVILDGYTWSSSAPEIVDVTAQGTTAVLTGNSIGTAIITVTNKNCAYSLQIIAQCVNPIAAAANPYIQLTSSVITVNVSTAYTSITADLIGGTDADKKNFVWTSSDTSVCFCYGQNEVGKIKAIKEGTAYITVSHPKSVYTAQILVVCDKKTETDCYISVPTSIINMKPTDSTQTITASLINGSETDKYNFTWSLDVYDVINLVYSANVCTIEPKQQGQTTITIHHPKSSYDQQIVVTVQEYTSFAFPEDYTSIVKGKVNFITMQVPTTKVSTYVNYTVENPNICSCTGTKSTAQITGINAGTTTVHASLIASSTGVVQAKADMLIYVKDAEINACYITSPSTIYTINKGKSQTLSANITGTGILTSDQQSLKWTTNDTDVISITGINTSGTVTGQSIYITALKSGEALITCQHDKAASTLQFYIVVPGNAQKTVTLNKSYITLVKGSSGTALKATIENAESTNDYNSLIWTVSQTGETEVCRILGSGQNVSIYPINVGEADIMVQIPDSDSVAKCTVKVDAGKSFVFESNSIFVQPFGVKKVKYIVSPVNANLTWTMNQFKDYFSFTDLGCNEKGEGYIQIEGISEGSGNLYCVTDGNAKGNLSIKVSWDYELTLIGKTTFSITPEEKVEIGYKVNPTYADIAVSSIDDLAYNYSINSNGDGTGTITIIPKQETGNNISINVTATNPNNGNELIGQKTISAKFAYSDSDIKPDISFTKVDGVFSSYDSTNHILNIGDGETHRIKITLNKSNANIGVYNVTFNSKNNVSITNYSQSTQTFDICSSVDTVDQVYVVSSAKKPIYYPHLNNNISHDYSDAFTIEDWKISFYWTSDVDHWWNFGDKEEAWVGLLSKTYSDKCIDINDHELSQYGVNKWVFAKNSEDYQIGSSWFSLADNPEETGKVYSKSEFENIAWYYCPGVSYSDDDISCSVPAGIWYNHVSATFGNSTDTNYVVNDLGTIKIFLTHNGKVISQPSEIKVYLYTRRCNKYCSK
jgi:hypothetical protein